MFQIHNIQQLSDARSQRKILQEVGFESNGVSSFNSTLKYQKHPWELKVILLIISFKSILTKVLIFYFIQKYIFALILGDCVRRRVHKKEIKNQDTFAG